MADVPDDGLLVEDDLPDGYRSGFVAVVGRPNVGKSTLMNRLLGEKLAIVSPRPQTTRENQLGIVTTERMQAVFIDTPGIHTAQNALGNFMVSSATVTIRDADLVMFIVDGSRPPTEEDIAVAKHIRAVGSKSVLLILNKRDLLPNTSEIPDTLQQYLQYASDADYQVVSALHDPDLSALHQRIYEALPEGPRYYPADQLTETRLRDNAAELIREQIMLQFEQEIPYAVAVQVDEFKERSEDMTYIKANIFVERDSQKGILIGKGGKMLKQVSQSARRELEAMLGTRVYLDLWVKVLKNWRKDENALRRLGYTKKK